MRTVICQENLVEGCQLECLEVQTVLRWVQVHRLWQWEVDGTASSLVQWRVLILQAFNLWILVLDKTVILPVFCTGAKHGLPL